MPGKRVRIYESGAKKMIDIKGLDKARVLKALYDHGHIEVVADGMVTVEYCAELLRTKTSFDYLRGRVIMASLSGDAFDERLYDLNCGAGAAQRAVDSVRAETYGSPGGGQKEPFVEEKVEQTKEAVRKILGTLAELPPDVCAAASTTLKIVLPGPGPMGALAGMMGGLFAPPPSPFEGWFGEKKTTCASFRQLAQVDYRGRYIGQVYCIIL